MAIGLHKRMSTESEPLQEPSIGDVVPGVDERVLWRNELVELVKARIGPIDKAPQLIGAVTQALEPLARREVRQIQGIEAASQLPWFERASALHDRMARAIARDLKAYRLLKTDNINKDDLI